MKLPFELHCIYVVLSPKTWLLHERLIIATWLGLKISCSSSTCDLSYYLFISAIGSSTRKNVTPCWRNTWICFQIPAFESTCLPSIVWFLSWYTTSTFFFKDILYVIGEYIFNWKYLSPRYISWRNLMRLRVTLFTTCIIKVISQKHELLFAAFLPSLNLVRVESDDNARLEFIPTCYKAA